MNKSNLDIIIDSIKEYKLSKEEIIISAWKAYRCGIVDAFKMIEDMYLQSVRYYDQKISELERNINHGK